LFGPLGLVIGILLNVLVLFVIAEAAPKTWALQHTERAALLTAPMIELLGKTLRVPARGLIGAANILLPGKGLKKGPFVTEEEILALAGEAAEHSVIEESERVLIESIINFGDTVAREIMVPRTDMVTIGADATVSELVDMAIDKGLSRFPVYGENADDIEGVVYVKDAMRVEREGGGDSKVMVLVRPGLFVPETKPVADLLAEMQSSHNHLAVVVDEYGGTAGLATLEDLLEELVGEIHDEFDEDMDLVEHLDNGDVIVNASMNVDDINDELHMSLPEGNWDSVGGLVFGLLGRVAVQGDSVEIDGTKIVVELVDGRRVVRVRLVNEPVVNKESLT
jgi:CBS domain containing-hemolysin-like protein